jgi:hypothetical protein
MTGPTMRQQAATTVTRPVPPPAAGAQDVLLG